MIVATLFLAEVTMRSTLLLLLAVGITPRLTAQWRFSLAAGPAVTAGHSLDAVDPDRPAILPDHPVNLVAGVARQHGPWRVAVEGHRITSDLAVRGASASVVTRGALSASGVGAELSRRIAASTAGPALYAGAGAIYERWAFALADGEARWRAAARASLELDVPLTRRWSALVRAEGIAGQSLFREEELPEGYSSRHGYRAGLLLGVALAGSPR
ncbi:MAG: hypothetical protein V4558_15145 [Gemmatimonadota bacterium]